MQNDIIQWNALKYSIQKDLVVQTTNKILKQAFEQGWSIIIAVRIQHPKHVCFATYGGFRKFSYCVMESWGAKLASMLFLPNHKQDVNAQFDLVPFGLNQHIESNDVFYNVAPSQVDTISDVYADDIKVVDETNLKRILYSRNCSALYICGLNMYDGEEDVYSMNTLHQTYETATLLGFNAVVPCNLALLVKQNKLDDLSNFNKDPLISILF